MAKRFFYLFFLILITSCTQIDNYENHLQELIDTEHAFAALSDSTGLRDAFTTYLADNAIVFRPKPVRGKPIYQQAPNIPHMLVWYPVWADISFSGDLGYTTGPYEYREDGILEPASSYGQFITIWKRQKNSLLRVVFDAGITHTKKDKIPVEVRHPRTSPEKINTLKSLQDYQKEEGILKKTALSFIEMANQRGYHEALISFAAPEIRVYRENIFPATELETIETVLKDWRGQFSIEILDAVVAESADLGYIYGYLTYTVKEGGQSQFSYIKIWKRQKGETWKIVLDLAVPIS